MPTITASRSATSGGAQRIEDGSEPLLFVVDEDIGKGLAEHQRDRQQHREQRDPE